jgi:hypothetical protein
VARARALQKKTPAASPAADSRPCGKLRESELLIAVVAALSLQRSRQLAVIAREGDLVS